MTKKKIALIAVIGVLAAFFLIPTAVGAVTQPQALAGLKEYYQFLLQLAKDMAEKGLDAYIEYLKAL